MAKTTIIPVKLCYAHIGGRLGSLLADLYISKGWIVPVEGNERWYSISAKGKKAFKELGLDLSLIPEETF